MFSSQSDEEDAEAGVSITSSQIDENDNDIQSLSCVRKNSLEFSLDDEISIIEFSIHDENDYNQRGILRIENPDYSWIQRLQRLQKAYILRVNQTQYELACLSTMGGAYSICQYPKEALLIAKQQELVGIRIGSKVVQCHAKLYQYINLIFLGKKKAGMKMLQDAKKQSEELENESVRKHCDVTENWLNNELKYKGHLRKLNVRKRK